MNIKSLLLGSAAALVAVSGARAADAVQVVAEPEPAEYVRICDTYGTGFYYIPGTETCLKVGGYLRYDIGVGEIYGFSDGVRTIDKKDLMDGTSNFNFNDTYYKRTRAALKLDARTETELGTLRAYMHINFDFNQKSINGVYDNETPANPADDVIIASSGQTGNNMNVNHAYIELGGFRIGKTDSLFTTFTDYAGGVIQDTLVPYGPFDTHQIAYTFNAGNGFTAAVALEAAGGAGGGIFDTNAGGHFDTTIPDVYAIDSYVPDVVAGVGYTGGWGSVRVVGGYDSVWEQFAAKARLDVKASDAISLFVMGGWKSNANDGTEPFNYYGNWGGDWAVWGGGTFQASEKAAVNLQLSYDDAKTFGAALNVAYTLVPGLTITPEVNYLSVDTAAGKDDAFGGFLRFQRDF